MLKPKYKNINFWDPVIGSQEIKLINKALKMNWPNEGHFTSQFEKRIEKLLNVKHAICTTSGTISIFLALKAVGIKQNDEVIVPDVTFGATAMAVKLANAKLVIVDVNKENISFNLDDLKRKITKKTKVIIPVHISGRAADLNGIKKTIQKKKIYIIEDAAESLYSKYKNKFLGTIGDLGCFSLTASKTITTGQGGIIVTNNSNLNNKLRLLKNQGIKGKSDGGDVRHLSVGYNFKFTNLQSAMGIAQLASLKQRVIELKKINLLYRTKLKNLSQIKILEFKKGEVPLWTDAIALQKRDELIKFLKKNKVECRKFWFPLHLQKPFKKPSSHFKNSSKIYNKLFWLPSSLKLKEKDIIYITNLIKKFYTKN